jgi:hypothetical protein
MSRDSKTQRAGFSWERKSLARSVFFFFFTSLLFRHPGSRTIPVPYGAIWVKSPQSADPWAKAPVLVEQQKRKKEEKPKRAKQGKSKGCG